VTQAGGPLESLGQEWGEPDPASVPNQESVWPELPSDAISAPVFAPRFDADSGHTGFGPAAFDPAAAAGPLGEAPDELRFGPSYLGYPSSDGSSSFGEASALGEATGFDDPLSLDRTVAARSASILERIAQDHREFYSRRSLTDLFWVTGGGAILANTSMDEEFRDFFQTNVTQAGDGEWSRFLHGTKEFGNGFRTLPIFAVAASTVWFDDRFPVLEPVGEWGNRSLRVFLVGAPVVAVGQLTLGASRPGEAPWGSRWQPFQDDNGVSGHAFMGAFPFLVAADMTENRWLRTGLIASSTLCGLSRINDEQHYASQVILGWTVAYLASGAIARSEGSPRQWRLIGWQDQQAQGIGIERRW